MTPTNEEIEALKAKAEAALSDIYELANGCVFSGDFRGYNGKLEDAHEVFKALISTITQLRARAEAAELKGWNEAIEAAEIAAFGASTTASEAELENCLEPICDAIRALKKEIP